MRGRLIIYQGWAKLRSNSPLRCRLSLGAWAAVRCRPAEHGVGRCETRRTVAKRAWSSSMSDQEQGVPSRDTGPSGRLVFAVRALRALLQARRRGGAAPTAVTPSGVDRSSSGHAGSHTSGPEQSQPTHI
ncbi:MAG: hypothetical protein NVS3B26_13870 [Mycobacteriales bacterium]